jgi:hypothetical protein
VEKAMVALIDDTVHSMEQKVQSVVSQIPPRGSEDFAREVAIGLFSLHNETLSSDMTSVRSAVGVAIGLDKDVDVIRDTFCYIEKSGDTLLVVDGRALVSCVDFSSPETLNTVLAECPGALEYIQSDLVSPEAAESAYYTICAREHKGHWNGFPMGRTRSVGEMWSALLNERASGSAESMLSMINAHPLLAFWWVKRDVVVSTPGAYCALLEGQLQENGIAAFGWMRRCFGKFPSKMDSLEALCVVRRNFPGYHKSHSIEEKEWRESVRGVWGTEASFSDSERTTKEVLSWQNARASSRRAGSLQALMELHGGGLSRGVVHCFTS